MFGTNNTGSGSLFNNINTSTPTSTPTPANNTLQKPFKVGGQQGIFGNVNSTAGVSTPSPSGSSLNNQASGSGLFGGTQTQSNNATGGLFGGNNVQNKTSGFSFGQNTTSGASSGLFGRSNSTPSGAVASGNKMNPGTGVFGSSQNGGGLFSGNKPTTTSGLFGNQQSSTNPQGSLSFNTGTSNSFASQPASNPYGLNIGGMPLAVSSMPASITAPTNDNKPSLDRSAGSTTSFTSGSTTANRRNYSISTATSNIVVPQVSLPASSKSSLINKLSARLKSAPNISSTQGIFSPSLDGQWSSQEQNLFNAKSVTESRDFSAKQKDSLASVGLAPLSLQRGSLSDMRKLKIDPGRSVAKKMKLFTGESTPTKSHTDNHDDEDLIDSSEAKVQNGGHADSTPKTQPLAKENSESNHNDNHDKISEDSPSEAESSGYWCSPSPEQLSNLTREQLAAVPNFLIGRKGYGSITFQYDVDLTAFAEDFSNKLFGKVVIFNPNKTVEVYPDEETKPSIGCGLNVPAIITLDNVFPIDKKSRRELKDDTNYNEVQILVRKLRNIRNMTFVSYNPFGGVWTFKVNHFSIWGLTNEEDAEVDEEEVKNAEKTIRENVEYSKAGQTLAQPNLHQEIIPGAFDSQKNEYVPDELTQRDLINFQQSSHADLHLESPQDSDFLVEEKPYEPDVNESDFEGMVADPVFSTSNNWVEQLQLAGSSLKSVFVETKHHPTSDSNDVELLFNEFHENLRKLKKAEEERRLVDFNFAKFSPDSSLLVKAPSFKSGVQSRTVPTKSLRDPAFVDALFSKYFNLCALTKRDANDCPKITSSQLQFRDVADLCSPSSTEYTLWSLCSVLFDPIEMTYKVEDPMIKDNLLKKERHSQICSWIVDQIRDEIDAKIKTETDSMEIIFLYLLKNDVANACKMAIKSQNGHLAVLLSSLGSNDPRIRDLAAGQLERWRSCGQKVSPSITRIYRLLAGTGTEERFLNKNEEKYVSWLSLLGANLYFGKIDELSLKEVISLSIQFPMPDKNDFKFIIFKLYSSQSPLEVTFEELKNAVSSLDYGLPWYIAQILRSTNHDMISDSMNDKLTFDFIGRLRLCRFHKEALFAASFFSDDVAAEQQIESLVYHEIENLTCAAHKEVLQRLNIPSRLVHRAAALKHKYDGEYLEEAQCLIKAEAYEEAEKVVIESVGPMLIINGVRKDQSDFTTLRRLLSSFPLSEMKKWSSGLGVYDNYVKLKLGAGIDKQLLDSLLDGVSLLFAAHSRSRAIPVCCNIISQDVAAMILDHQGGQKDDSYKEKLLRLPLGQPEKKYLELLLS